MTTGGTAGKMQFYSGRRPVPTFALLLLLLLCATCTNRTAEDKGQAGTTSSGYVKYASGFEVATIATSKLVTVNYPFQGATSGYTYLLVPRGDAPPAGYEDATVIYTPVETIVCTSTTHIPLLDYLGETDKLVGFPTTDYISSEAMRRRIEAGDVTELGVDNDLNLERLAVLDPDVVMGYTMTSDYGQFGKIEALGIPVVINAEYLEPHPLGRAEWIKFIALFFNKEQRADSVFSSIEQAYLDAKAIAEKAPKRPTVLSGIVYGDAWFLPGGENHQAKLFRDAGCHYLWEDNESNGYLQLSFESVYATAKEADLWIGTGTYNSLADLAAADPRYTRFEAFKGQEVYNYDARLGAMGGNEYLELGYLRPDLVIRDLIRIAHPTLLPSHELFFHRKLPQR